MLLLPFAIDKCFLPLFSCDSDIVLQNSKPGNDKMADGATLCAMQLK